MKISTSLVLFLISGFVLGQTSFSFNTKFTIIKLWYNNGSFVTIQADVDDPEVTNFIGALDTYLQTGNHCYLNSRSCEFRFKQTIKEGNKTWSGVNYNVINFDSLSVVQVSKNFSPPTTCNVPDHSCSIFVSNNVFNAMLDFNASWTYVLGNQEFGFNYFASTFKNYKGGATVDKKKWEFRSECTKNYTAIYIMDFSKVNHVQTRSKQLKN